MSIFILAFMVFALSIYLGMYLLMIIAMIIGWYSIKPNPNEGLNLRISVIVPVRNEENSIGDLLEDLAKQSIDHKDYEVWIVNDQSSDQTMDIVVDYAQKHPEFDLRYWHSTGQGKKKALEEGIRCANYPNIITTDGDCRVSRNWLRSFQREFSDERVELVSGPVSFHNDQTIFMKLQSMEFAGLIGMGAAGIYFGKPNMCNGANLGFRKVAYHKVGGYFDNMHIPSGDDEFLMHKISKEIKNSVRFMKDRDAIVTTGAHASIRSFFHQRKRWASKWSFYTITGPKITAIFTWVFYIFLLISTLMAAFGYYPLEILAIQWGVKLLIDGFYLYSMMKFFQKPFNPLIFLLMELLYPPYVIIFGMSSNFGSYEWKGRKFSRNVGAGVPGSG